MESYCRSEVIFVHLSNSSILGIYSENKVKRLRMHAHLQANSLSENVSNDLLMHINNFPTCMSLVTTEFGHFTYIIKEIDSTVMRPPSGSNLVVVLFIKKTNTDVINI